MDGDGGRLIGPPRVGMRTGNHSISDIVGCVAAEAGVRALAEALRAGRHVAVAGSVGSSTSFVAAAVARLARRPVVLVLGHIDDADEAVDELDAAGVEAMRLPALEVMPGESNVSPELLAERLGIVRRVLALGGSTGIADPPNGEARGTSWPVLICPIQSLMQAVPRADRLDRLARTVRRGETVAPGDLVRWLDAAGYTRRDAVEEPGDFAMRGGILDVFGVTGAARLDFFGDQIERITEVDLDSLASGRALDAVELVTAKVEAIQGEEGVSFLDLVPAGFVALVAETLEVTEQGRGYFERVTDQRGVFGPPAVFKKLSERSHGLAEINQFSGGGASADVRVELPVAAVPSFSQDAAEAVKELAGLAASHDIVVFCQTGGELQRFQELVAEFSPGSAGEIEARLSYLHRGFVWGRDEETERRRDGDADAAASSLRRCVSPSLFLPYHELVHRYTTRRRAAGLRAGRAMDTFLDFAPGDFVVHAEHGIARYLGLKTMKSGDGPLKGVSEGGVIPDGLLPADQRSGPQEPQEYLTLEFAGRAKLHVPAVNIDLVQKYVGGFRGKPPLSTLGGQRWKSQKERVSESVKDLAAEMLRVRAARDSMPGIRYPGDTAWQREFEAEFPYDETEDQLAALSEIKKDMQAERPMDRLVCGDVGFGKTELAIRAAFKAAEFGKQVAVLVPTTVLAEQHERTFKSRFAGYPFRVESLSRFKSDAQQKEVLKALAKGQVDIVIGTHRLLSQDVTFADLGLVVIDEEQRFGVEHKEVLLRFRLTVDVLTLSATPIPRTLHMAMLGLRDISSLTTPPLDRRAIVTEVIPMNERRVAQALARELAREGQVYFVHNRVHDIRTVADQVQKLAPDARVVVGHGQMAPHELEEVMVRFMRRDADILVSTTIIESGIDIPTANTMFIDNADRFGLADLHQLRGRVGRYKHRAYCYMLLPEDRPVSEVAQRRLKAIEQYAMLGAGFKIAMRDLEIRGAGNLLGAEQSGHIAAVGYDMYCRLLDQAVRELKHEAPPPTASRASIEIGIVGTIPKPYIPSDQRRLEAYRRIAVASTSEELGKVSKDLTDAYGEPPPQTRRLLDLAELRLVLLPLGVRTVTLRGQDVLFRTERPDALGGRLGAAKPGPSVDTAARPRSFAERAGRQATATRPQPRDQLSVRVLPPPAGERLHEVYLRVPRNYLEPGTLLAVLLRRVAATGAGG